MKTKAFVFLLALFFNSVCFSFSLLLMNDSPLELTAIVLAANNNFLGQEILQPGEQKRWSTEAEHIYDANVSLTPFTVVWRCSYQGIYSTNINISPGATVKANEGAGS